MSGPQQAHCVVELAGEILWLLAHKAVYWPARRMLVIADIHFGKAAAFRALGVPVPRGTTTQNLLALDVLLASYACEEIVFLGDFCTRAPRMGPPPWPPCRPGARAIRPCD